VIQPPNYDDDDAEYYPLTPVERVVIGVLGLLAVAAWVGIAVVIFQLWHAFT